MFQPFRTLSAAILELRTTLKNESDRQVTCLLELRRAITENGPATTRLEDIERRQAMWEVEMEALVATAKGKFEAANNAESRTRSMKKYYEKNVDPFGEESEEVPAALPTGDALGGETEGVPPLRVDVAANHKANALMYKFSR